MTAKQASKAAKLTGVFGQRQEAAKMFRIGLYARVSTHDRQTLTSDGRKEGQTDPEPASAKPGLRLDIGRTSVYWILAIPVSRLRPQRVNKESGVFVSPEREPNVDPCSGTRSVSDSCFGFAVETRNGSSNRTTMGFITASSSSHLPGRRRQQREASPLAVDRDRPGI